MERIKRELCSVVLLIALASIHKLLPIQLCDARVLDFTDDEIGQSDGRYIGTINSHCLQYFMDFICVQCLLFFNRNIFSALFSTSKE